MIKITPQALNLKARYTLLEAASHHDPTRGDGSNKSLYRRHLVLMPFQANGRPLTKDWHAKIADAFPVPTECLDLFVDEPFERFLGIALVKVFIQNYGRSTEDGTWGQGLFTGTTAYSRLANRIELAAPRALNLKEFWAMLTRDMNVDILEDNAPAGRKQATASLLFQILAVPSRCHHHALYHLEKYATMIVEMARFWKDTAQLANKTYAEKAGKAATTGDTVRLNLEETFTNEHLHDEPTRSTIAIPVHSGNDIRHDIRYAGMMHLFAHLQVDPEKTMLPTSVKALLENGGNIGKAQSAPSTAYALAQAIRNAYPSLSLLGGCTDSFMLGDSNLQSVSCFWFAREFNDALEELFGVKADTSILDLLDEWTLHRHVGRYDGSPMPYSFETVTAGAQLYVNFQLSPWGTELERGAFIAALETFKDIDGHIGGQAAKGFGRVSVEILHETANDTKTWQNARSAYEQYLAENRLRLLEGLKTGTLCSEKVVCT